MKKEDSNKNEENKELKDTNEKLNNKDKGPDIKNKDLNNKNINNNSKISDKRKEPGFFKLFCELISNYCNYTICDMCYCREDLNKNICCCCPNYDESHFDKKKQCFCYCYQEKSIFYLLNSFFLDDTQKKIIPFIIFYFICKLIIIGSEEKYEIIIRNNDTKDMQIFLIAFIGFFSYLTFLLLIIYFLLRCISKKFFSNKNFNYHNIMLMTLLYVNNVLGWVYSYQLLFLNYEDTKIFFFLP